MRDPEVGTERDRPAPCSFFMRSTRVGPATWYLMAAVLIVSLMGCLPQRVTAASMVFINDNQPGAGFNDASTNIHPATGNPGRTLGAQRRNAFRLAARMLASKVQSDTPIVIRARFKDLVCGRGRRPTTLGLGGFWSARTFTTPPPGASPNVFYPIALANALSGRDMADGEPDIDLSFNSAVDNNPDCLGMTQGDSINFYYGYDGNPPGQDVDFLTVATHELIHGLGFETTANLTTGRFPYGKPDIYSTLIRSLYFNNADWPQLSPGQRVTSATQKGQVVWDGPHVTKEGVPTLQSGLNDGMVKLYAPDSLEPGSSISHWSLSLKPDGLMEPYLRDPRHVMQGIGLASCALEDMGYRLALGVVCPDETVIRAAPPGIRFGQAREGEAPVQAVHIVNQGAAPVTLGDVAHDDPLDAPFSIASDECSHKTLAPDQGCTIQVNFSPSGYGDFGDSFDVPPARDSGMSSIRVFVDGVGPPSGREGGGGCVMARSDVPFGPVFPLLLVLSILALCARRIAGREHCSRMKGER